MYKTIASEEMLDSIEALHGKDARMSAACLIEAIRVGNMLLWALDTLNDSRADTVEQELPQFYSDLEDCMFRPLSKAERDSVRSMLIATVRADQRKC